MCFLSAATNICKNNIKRIKFIFVMIFIILFFPLCASANLSEKLEINVISDKNKYVMGETISITIQIINTNNWTVQIENPQLDLPEGLTLKGEILWPKEIAANSTINLEALAVFNQENSFNQAINVSNSSGQQFNIQLSALEGTFEAGSTFAAAPISVGSARYNQLYNDIDANYSEKIERMQIFDFSVTKPDGTKYTTFSKSATLMIEVPEGWDIGELKAIFVSTAKDEEFEVFYNEIDGKTYACFNVVHFSPYALIDVINKNSLTSQNDSNFPLTGENFKNIMICSVIVIILISAFLSKIIFRKFIISLLLICLISGHLAHSNINNNKTYALNTTQSNNYDIKYGGNELKIKIYIDYRYNAINYITQNQNIFIDVEDDFLDIVNKVKISELSGKYEEKYISEINEYYSDLEFNLTNMSLPLTIEVFDIDENLLDIINLS